MDCDSERIWKIVESQRIGVPRKKHVPGRSPSLFDRLYDCYVDRVQTNANDKAADKRFRSAVNLLLRVERAHAKPSLIVSLYEDEKGYSLILCHSEGGETEEIFLPYEDNEIFSYLDNQQVPPVLLEVLQPTECCNLYNGSVVCELRDYRCHSVLDGYDTHLLLLRPTTETILATVNELALESKCTQEEKLFIESQLLLATQPPICLDVSTDVLCVTNRLQYNRRKFHTHGIRRYLRKRCHASRALMQLKADEEAPDQLKLNDFFDGKSLSSQRRDFSNCWKKRKRDVSIHQDGVNVVARDVLKSAKQITQASAAFTQPNFPLSALSQSDLSTSAPPLDLPSGIISPLAVPQATIPSSDLSHTGDPHSTFPQASLPAPPLLHIGAPLSALPHASLPAPPLPQTSISSSVIAHSSTPLTHPDNGIPPLVLPRANIPSSPRIQHGPSHFSLPQPVLSQSPISYSQTSVVRMPSHGSRKPVTVEEQDNSKDAPSLVPCTVPAEEPFHSQLPQPTLTLSQSLPSFSQQQSSVLHPQLLPPGSSLPPSILSTQQPTVSFQKQQILANQAQAFRSLFTAQQPGVLKNISLQPITPGMPSLHGPRVMKNLSSSAPPQLRAIVSKPRDTSGVVQWSSVTSQADVKTVSAGMSFTSLPFPSTSRPSSTSAVAPVLPTLQEITSVISATPQTVPVPVAITPILSHVGGPRVVMSTLTPPVVMSTLTPPKLNSPLKSPLSSSQATSSGMPKLHPLLSDLSKPLPLKVKPSPPLPVSPQLPVIVPKETPSVISVASPIMPQLHRMPPGTKLATPPLVKAPLQVQSSTDIQVPSMPPTLKRNPNLPVSSLRSTTLSAVPLPTVSQSPSSTFLPSSVSVVRSNPKLSAEAVQRIVEAQTRLPPSLSSLGANKSTLKESVAPSKHSQSRSSKLMSGNKVVSRSSKKKK